MDGCVNFLFAAGIFVFSFAMPFHDIPKWELWGMSVRYAVFGIAPTALILAHRLYIGRLDWRTLFDRTVIWPCAMLALTLLIILLRGPTVRSLGFCAWLMVNITYFLGVVHIDSKWAIRGFVAGQVCNAAYIILQNYLYPFIWVPESYFYALRMGQFRNFGLMGEPSWVAIAMTPALFYVYDKINNWLGAVMVFILILAHFLIYSAIGLIVFFIFLTATFYREEDKKFALLVVPPVIIGFALSILQHPRYYGLQASGLESLNRWRSFDSRSVEPESLARMSIGTPPPDSNEPSEPEPSDLSPWGIFQAVNRFAKEQFVHEPRLLSLSRGLEYFLSHPFGTGIGENKSYLVEYFSPHLTPEDRPPTGIHNIFLEVAVEFGFLGLLLFMVFLAMIYILMYINGSWTYMWMCTTMLAAMQFAQNINMPAMWIVLSIGAASCSRKPYGYD